MVISRFVAAQKAKGVRAKVVFRGAGVDDEAESGEQGRALPRPGRTLLYRGMRLLYEAGGVTTTILNDHMQRAPAFIFADARMARSFAGWLDEHFAEIKRAAETTTRTGRLLEIEKYPAGRVLYTRFNYTTGDAAGQNLTGKATQAACRWIKAEYPGIEHYILESNFANAWKFSTATARTGSASSPKSSPPPSCAENCPWGRPLSPKSGWKHTTCTAATDHDRRVRAAS